MPGFLDPARGRYRDVRAQPIEDLSLHYPDIELPPPAPPPLPWHRNARVLITLISASASVLVVAGALLATLNHTAPTRVRPGTAIPPLTAAPPRPAAPPAAGLDARLEAETAAETAAAAEAAAETEAEFGAGAEAGAPTAGAGTDTAGTDAVTADAATPVSRPAPQEAAVPADEGIIADQPTGPRINVTRSPMSFTPAPRG